MLHCDPESLALRSLGEPVDCENESHIGCCEQCQSDLASLVSVVATARSGDRVVMESPPPAVWQRIADDLSLSAPGPAEVSASHAEVGPTPEPSRVVSLDERRARRRRPATWLLAAAGIGGILVGGVATAMVVAPSTSEQATVAASVDLAPLPSWDATGSADLTVTDDGQQVLVVSVDAAAAADADGYQEVWLIDTDVAGMVSLGILEGTSGEFVVPDGVDVGQFPVVDVSLEPFDGDPTHSGDSIVRGQIEA